MRNSTEILSSGIDEVVAGTKKLGEMIARYTGPGVGGSTPVPGLALARLPSKGEATSYIYEPSLCIIAQGSKRLSLGEVSYRYDEQTFLLTAVGLPTVTQIERASNETPYTSLQLLLDLDVAGQLIADMAVHGHKPIAKAAGMVTAPLTTDLLEPVLRLVELLNRPEDIPILAGGIHREILYRLLRGPEGVRLSEIVRQGSHGNRSAKAITWLRQNFRRRLSIEDLAQEAGMAVSTLHRHFKSVTNMSPLQFQKHLRLHEARRLMLTENLNAGVAALQVGYESDTHFNREYRRLFGTPPRRDIDALQAPGQSRRSFLRETADTRDRPS
jgi:AraC-like DNA-binding protein